MLWKIQECFAKDVLLTHEKFTLLGLALAHESEVSQAAHFFSVTITANSRENAS